MNDELLCSFVAWMLGAVDAFHVHTVEVETFLRCGGACMMANSSSSLNIYNCCRGHLCFFTVVLGRGH
jgi:hypothetical protein